MVDTIEISSALDRFQKIEFKYECDSTDLSNAFSNYKELTKLYYPVR